MFTNAIRASKEKEGRGGLRVGEGGGCKGKRGRVRVARAGWAERRRWVEGGGGERGVEAGGWN